MLPKRMVSRACAATAACAALMGPGPAGAAQVFFADYNGANGGASQANISGTYDKFVGTPPGFGKVDLFSNGDGGVICGAGFTSCISLESSDGHYGQVTTIDPALGAGQPTVSVHAGATVTVSFEVSGNQSPFADPDYLNVRLGFFGGPVDPGPITLGGAWSGVIDPPGPAAGISTGAYLAPDSPFQLYTMSFVAPQDLGLSVTLKGGLGANVWTGADGFGPILDYVAIDVTDPAGVPEPAIWALMLAGFGGVGGMLRRRRVAYA